MAARPALFVLLAPTFALATAGFPAGPARASEPPASLEVANPNAALRYWLAFGLFSQDALDKAATIDWTPIAKELNPAKMPKEFKDVAAADCELGVETLLWASGAERCDFELHYDAGIHALLPHLAKMRASARLLRVDARKHLLAGDADGAVERVVAMERMAAHLTSDRVVISSLVGYAIASIGLAETETILASGKMTEAGRTSLLAALQALDTKDPIGMRGALAFEKATTSAWVRRTFTGPQAGRDLAELLGAGAQDESDVLHSAAIAGLDEAGLNADLERYGAVWDEMLAAWDGPDAKARLTALGDRISAGDYGLLAGILSPAAEKARASADKFQAALKATIQKVEAASAPGAVSPAPNTSGAR